MLIICLNSSKGYRICKNQGPDNKLWLKTGYKLAILIRVMQLT